MKKIKKNSGAAMIAVLCIMAIFVTLCLSMMLTASVMMSNSQHRMYEEQCKVSAISMSKELENDLKDTTSGFYQYIKTNVNITHWSSWPYLNEDELGHGKQSPGIYREFTVSGGDLSKTGDVSAKMYWEYADKGAVSDVFLYVEVTATKNGESYTVKSIYNAHENAANQEFWMWDLSERS